MSPRIPDITGHRGEYRMAGVTAHGFVRLRYKATFDPCEIKVSIVGKQITFWPEPCEATCSPEVLEVDPW